MTPPPRWVLLAFLLPVVSAHPADHACVRLCRAHNTISRPNGVCEDQQKLVLQSVRGRLPIRRLFRLCLTSCHGAPPADSPAFDHSETCRVFRQFLIQREGCPCLNHDRTPRLDPRKSEGKNREEDLVDVGRKLEGPVREESEWEGSETIGEESQRVDKVSGKARGGLRRRQEEKESKRVDGLKMSRKNGEESFVDLQRGSWKLEDLLGGMGSSSIGKVVVTRMEEEEEEEDSSRVAESFEETAVGNLNTGSPVEGADSTEDDSIDWDLWCMEQCYIGQGGSACHCDIIP